MNTLTLLVFALFSATLIGPALADGVIDNKGDLLFTKNTTVVGNDRALGSPKHISLISGNESQDGGKPSEDLRVVSDRLGRDVLNCLVLGGLCGVICCLVMWRLSR